MSFLHTSVELNINAEDQQNRWNISYSARITNLFRYKVLGENAPKEHLRAPNINIDREMHRNRICILHRYKGFSALSRIAVFPLFFAFGPSASLSVYYNLNQPFLLSL